MLCDLPANRAAIRLMQCAKTLKRRLAAQQVHDLHRIQAAGFLPDLRQVLSLHLFGRREQALKGVAQYLGVHGAAACVVAFGYLAQRIGGGK